MSDPTNLPTPAPISPDRAKPRRSFLSKHKQPQPQAPIVAIPTIDGVVDDNSARDNDSNVLNSTELTRPLGSTQPSSSRAHGQIIRRARERMNASADRLISNQLAIIDRGMALAGTDSKYLDVARRANEALMIAVNDDGERLITKEQPASPQPATIQIGIALGGLPSTSKRVDA